MRVRLRANLTLGEIEQRVAEGFDAGEVWQRVASVVSQGLVDSALVGIAMNGDDNAATTTSQADLDAGSIANTASSTSGTNPFSGRHG